MTRGSIRVEEYLDKNNVNTRKVVLDKSTKTSRMAANLLGCSVAQIAKSIVFVNAIATVVVISGDKRVNPKKLSDHLGHDVKIGDADAVRNRTGYIIGGVPPFPHDDNVSVLLDESLKRFEDVWAAAGTPRSVMNLKVEELQSIIGEPFIDLSQ